MRLLLRRRRLERANTVLWTLGLIWLAVTGFLVWRFGPALWYRYVSPPRRPPPRFEMGSSSRDPGRKRPLPATTPLSVASLEAEQLAWGRRKMLEAYRTVGQRDPRWDQAVEAFLAEILPWAMQDRVAPRRPPLHLLPATESILAAGCTDPVALGLIGVLRHAATPDLSEGFHLLKRAVAGLTKSRYCAGVGRWFAGELELSGTPRPDARRITEEVDKLALVWLAASLKDDTYEGVPWLAVQHYLRGTGAKLADRHERECFQQFEQSTLPPAIKHYAVGRRLSAEALKVYKSGREHRSALALYGQARGAYEASWRADSSRPEAASQMIMIAGWTGAMGEERQWFERATSVQIDYPAAFHTLSWYYLPRWGGSHRLILELAEECVATGRYDTLLPLTIVEACDLVDKDMGYPGLIYRHPKYRPSLREVFQRYENTPAQDGRRAFLRSLQCVVAWKSGERDEAYRLLRAVDFQLDLGPLYFAGEDLSWLTSAIIQHGNPQPASLEEIEAVRKRGDRIAARTLLRELLAFEGFKGFGRPRSGSTTLSVQSEDGTIEYFGPGGAVLMPPGSRAREIRSRLAALDLSERLEGASWARFMPTALQQDQALVGWTRRSGDWQLREDGALEGRAPANDLLLASDTAIGPDFDVRGEFELEAGATEGTVAFGGADFSKESWLQVRMQREGAAGRVLVGTPYRSSTPTVAQLRERNGFVVRCWQGKVTVHLNGATVVSELAPVAPIPRDPELRVAVGGWVASGPAGGKVRFRNLEVRRLRAQ